MRTRAPAPDTPMDILVRSCEERFDCGTYFDSKDIQPVSLMERRGWIVIYSDDDGVRLRPTDKGRLVYHRHMVKTLRETLRQEKAT